MAFRSVFEKTFTDLTGWKSALWMIPLMTLFMVGSVWMACTEPQASLQMRIYFTTSQLLLLGYYVLSGFFICLLVSASAAGFIAKEENDGTLLILASKPIRRRDILLGKLVALFVRTILLEAILLLLVALISRFVLHLDEAALTSFLRAVMWLLFYSVLTIAFFGTIAAALSTLTRNLVVIMVVLAVLVMFCFLAGPMVRSMLPEDGGFYIKYHLYYIDISYHLQNAFVPFWEQGSGGEIIPQFSNWFGFQWIVMESGDSGLQCDSVRSCGYVSPVASVLLVLGIAVVALATGLRVLERKEIHQ
ncbi:MAG: ABC transporter permease subunit [Dehalococcoidia bacterium]|nr:ABC transporter permease subunit [Dehalococcoidia bacterium]